MRFPTMWYVRPEYLITFKLLTEHHLEFLNLIRAAHAHLSLLMSKWHIV